MNRCRPPVLIFASAIVAASLIGCGGGVDRPPRGQINFKAPRLPPVPPYEARPVDAALQRRAAEEITLAATSTDEVVRAQALEATSRTQDAAAVDRVARALLDSAWIVRFAGAMCAGDLKLKQAYAPLVAAADDPRPSVRVAVRYALHRLGDTSRSKNLETLSQHPDPRVRGNVATVIGLLKEPTGVRVVRPLLSDPDFGVRVQSAEALWRLGDEQGLKNLIAGTISPYPDDQIVSVLALAAPRDRRVRENILGKLAISKDGQQYLELQLAAARALGMLGDDAGYGVAARAVGSGDPRQRSLAAFALGEIGRTDAQPALAKLLADPDRGARLAAATALRQIALRPKPAA